MSADTSIHARLIFALDGHSYIGLRLSAIAEAIGESAPTTLRALQRAQQDGLVEQTPIDEKLWRLSPRLIQVALRHSSVIQREESRLAEFNSRCSRQS